MSDLRSVKREQFPWDLFPLRYILFLVLFNTVDGDDSAGVPVVTLVEYRGLLFVSSFDLGEILFCTGLPFAFPFDFILGLAYLAKHSSKFPRRSKRFGPPLGQATPRGLVHIMGVVICFVVDSCRSQCLNNKRDPVTR